MTSYAEMYAEIITTENIKGMELYKLLEHLNNACIIDLCAIGGINKEEAYYFIVGIFKFCEDHNIGFMVSTIDEKIKTESCLFSIINPKSEASKNQADKIGKFILKEPKQQENIKTLMEIVYYIIKNSDIDYQKALPVLDRIERNISGHHGLH